MLTETEAAIIACACCAMLLTVIAVQVIAERGRRPWTHYRTRLGVDPSLYTPKNERKPEP